MARVLIYTAPGSGHAYPPVATAIALRDRGHDVRVRTASGSVEAIGRLGLAATAIDPRVEAIPLEDWKARTPIGALIAAGQTFDRRARYEVPDLQGAIEAEDPELLWVDINAPGAAVAAEASGLPWAHYLPYPHPLPARGVPSFGPGFAPSRSPLAGLRDAGLEAFKKRAFRPMLRSQNSRRVALGLPPLGSVYDFAFLAPLAIQFSAEPFEYPREWPENVRLVGPALWEPPGPEPEWLAAEQRPIVLVTASTEFQDDAKLIHSALEAFADWPYTIVATTATHDPGDFDVPPNARVERYLPHAPILRRAAAVISHGGMGTTQKALAAGVPVCAVPFMRDQFEVARRVEHCGGGTLLAAKRLRPERLRSAVERAIARREGAERVRDAFSRAGGAEAAASALEELLAGGSIRAPLP
jgi:UDP:flavonoid glycosyltransferase YjiC (YdhE family)